MNTDTLDFPEITEPAARTEVAAAAALTIDLEKVDLKKLALARFGDWRKATADTKTDLTSLALDLSNQARIDEAKSLRARKIAAPLAAARATSKALKSKLADTSKAVGAELELIEAAWEGAETAITPQIDAAQKKLDDAKAEAARVEAERIAGLREKVDGIMQTCLDRCDAAGMTPERIAAGMLALGSMQIPSAVEEVGAYWTARQAETLQTMSARQIDMERKAEAARLVEQRAELERQAAELAEARRVLAEQQAEAQRQAEELRRKTQAEWDALQARIDAEAEAEREAAQAAAQNIEGQGDRQVLKAEPATADATDRAAPADASPVGGPMGDGQPAAAGPAVVKRVITIELDDTEPEPLPPQPEPATLSLGAIGDRLGFALPQVFIRVQLGIEPADNRGRAVLYRESQWAGIKAALAGYVGGLA